MEFIIKGGDQYFILRVVESNIGFIESYFDLLDARAEFVGFFAYVNKVISQKYTTFIKQAEDLIKKLPLSQEFEKDKFS